MTEIRKMSGKARDEIVAIPTVYNGRQFKSKTESLWARFFDDVGMRWRYEFQGINLDGLWYLPDFWLTDCRTIFECKGVWQELDKRKLRELWEKANKKNFTIAVGEYDGFNLVLGIVSPWDENQPVIQYEGSNIFRCSECGKPFILSELGSYACKNCGASEGDHHLGELLLRNSEPIPERVELWR